MRILTITERGFAAESLAMAYSHIRTAECLIREKDYAGSISQLYYACMFAAKTALADLGRRSAKHAYWVGEFNKRFGNGGGWIPAKYAQLLNKLYSLRALHDYKGAIPCDKPAAQRYLKASFALVNKVRRNTPLVHYPEFIVEFAGKHPDNLALEFDYYCPKSYIHKERFQFQIKSENATVSYIRRIIRIGRESAKTLSVNRVDEYVLGWNCRLGQSADGYLLFLDLDESDEGAIKSALSGTKGWLFKTGSGYHFIGQELYNSQKMWLRRMKEAARSKRLKHLIDLRHVDFSVRRGYATLRISKSGVKSFIPFLCWDNT